MEEINTNEETLDAWLTSICRFFTKMLDDMWITQHLLSILVSIRSNR